MRLIDADILIDQINDAISVGRKADMPVFELEAILDDVLNMATAARRLLCKTATVEIEEKSWRGHTYYTLWWYAEDSHDLRGFMKYYDLDAAYQAALHLIIGR